MKQKYRRFVAALVIWFVIANLLYFSTSRVASPCNELPGWLPLWVPFTFGIKELFPYYTARHVPSLESRLKEGAEYFCYQDFLFDEVGYAYFVLAPVAIVVAGYFLYQWAFKKSNNALTAE
jgi:hypothetical protein